jgi:hypothetical protein
VPKSGSTRRFDHRRPVIHTARDPAP